MRALPSIIVATVIATTSFASADPWKIAADAALQKKPGARQKPIGKLRAGTPVTIEREEGAWVRVRAGKRVGYVARTALVDEGKPVEAPAPVPAAVEPPRPVDPSIAARTTTIEVTLRKQPGERQAVVAKLARNTRVVIEVEEGRWYRVRAGKQVGYVPRTTLDEPPPSPAPATTDAPPEPHWSSERVAATKTGATGLVVGVAADSAALRAEARSESPAIAQATRGDRLAVLEATSGWIRVRTTAGRDAWIARGDIDDATAGIAVTGTIERGPDTARNTPSRPHGSTLVRGGVAIGYRSLGMDFTSNGSTGLSNYLVSADAAAADLELEAGTALAFARLGFDGRVQVGTSAPGDGIEYVGPSRAGGRIAFETLAADAGVRIGTRAKRIFDVAARTGFHYDAFVAKEVANAGRLPREHLYGATAGVRIAIVPAASRVDVELRTDVLVLGRRGQTAGLQDGASSSAHAVWAGATFRYAIGRHLSVISAYDFGRATTEWTGMSVRDPSATSARRVDQNQTVRLGLAARL